MLVQSATQPICNEGKKVNLKSQFENIALGKEQESIVLPIWRLTLNTSSGQGQPAWDQTTAATVVVQAVSYSHISGMEPMIMIKYIYQFNFLIKW